MGLPAGESRSFPSGPATPGAKARESGRRFSSSGEDQRRSSSAPSLLGPDGTALARAANPVRGPEGPAGSPNASIGNYNIYTARLPDCQMPLGKAGRG